MILGNAHISKKPFDHYVKTKIWLGGLIALTGVVTFILMIGSMYGVFTNVITSNSESFASGFYTGIGGGLAGAGIATVIKYARLLRNPQKFKMAEIEYHDERNRYIISRTFSLTTFISLFTLLLAVIVFGLIDHGIFITLLFTLGVYAMILFITYIIVSKSC